NEIDQNINAAGTVPVGVYSAQGDYIGAFAGQTTTFVAYNQDGSSNVTPVLQDDGVTADNEAAAYQAFTVGPVTSGDYTNLRQINVAMSAYLLSQATPSSIGNAVDLTDEGQGTLEGLIGIDSATGQFALEEPSSNNDVIVDLNSALETEGFSASTLANDASLEESSSPLSQANFAALQTLAAALDTAANFVTDISQLSTQQIQALTGTQIASLSATQIDGLSQEQIAALTPTQIASLTSGELQQLSQWQWDGFTAAQLKELSIAQLSGASLPGISPTALNQLSESQIASLQSIPNLGSGVSELSATTLQSLTSAQFSQLFATGADTAEWLTATQVSFLTGPMVSELGSAVSEFGPSQVAALSSAGLAALSGSQISSLSDVGLIGLTSSQIASLTTAQVAEFGANSFGNLSAQQVADFSAAQLAALSPAAISSLNWINVQGLSPATLAAMSLAQIAAITPYTLSRISSAQLASLTPSQISALTTSQVAALGDLQVSSLSDAQVGALSSAQLGALNTNQVAQFTAAQFASLTSAAIGGLTTAQLDYVWLPWLSPAQVTGLSTSTIAGMSTSEITWLSDAQFGALTAEQISALTAAQVSQVSGGQLASLGSVQLGGLSSAQIAALSATQLAAFSDSQLESFNAAQIAAISNGQLSAVSVDQVQSLENAAITDGLVADATGIQGLANPIGPVEPTGQMTVQNVTNQLQQDQGFLTAAQAALTSYPPGSAPGPGYFSTVTQISGNQWQVGSTVYTYDNNGNLESSVTTENNGSQLTLNYQNGAFTGGQIQSSDGVLTDNPNITVGANNTMVIDQSNPLWNSITVVSTGSGPQVVASGYELNSLISSVFNTNQSSEGEGFTLGQDAEDAGAEQAAEASGSTTAAGVAPALPYIGLMLGSFDSYYSFNVTGVSGTQVSVSEGVLSSSATISNPGGNGNSAYDININVDAVGDVDETILIQAPDGSVSTEELNYTESDDETQETTTIDGTSQTQTVSGNQTDGIPTLQTLPTNLLSGGGSGGSTAVLSPDQVFSLSMAAESMSDFESMSQSGDFTIDNSQTTQLPITL
ncbi:MAG: hypothetical protein ABR949_13140, partial [Candidatus Aquilonibacter sp.]